MHREYNSWPDYGLHWDAQASVEQRKVVSTGKMLNSGEVE